MIIPLALDRVRLAALAGLVVFASPMGGALADKPVDRVSSVDDPGRIPYQSVAQQGAGGTQFNFKFPGVPPGHRLVIEHISGDLLFQSPPTRDVQAAALVSFGAASAFFVSFSNETVLFDQSVQLNVNAGDSPAVFVKADNGTDAPTAGNLTLTGYLLDCTSIPCAQIAA
jgi:hypothetical protein